MKTLYLASCHLLDAQQVQLFGVEFIKDRYLFLETFSTGFCGFEACFYIIIILYIIVFLTYSIVDHLRVSRFFHLASCHFLNAEPLEFFGVDFIRDRDLPLETFSTGFWCFQPFFYVQQAEILVSIASRIRIFS